MDADGLVRLGPALDAADCDASLAATVTKTAYLGSFQELSVETALGRVFVVSSEPRRQWAAGDRAGLRLGGPGVSVVAA